MADKGTEQATPLRKKKARDRGDSVHSRELLSAMAMLGGVMMLGSLSNGFVSSWRTAYFASLRAAIVTGNDQGGERLLVGSVRQILLPVLMPVGLIMAASFAGALVSGVGQSGGIRIQPTAVQLKFAKLNPVTNLGNLFSLRSATRITKSLAPAVVMAIFGWGALKALMNPMPVMSLSRLPATFSTAYRLALDAAWVTLVWSGLDYAMEWRSWNQRLKMSKQELRDEMRDSMGNPQIKAKIRQIQRAMRKRRVKADMSRASVVITNPTHYAVALEFSFETMSAPTVLAKGRDLLAAEIREEARWAGIPIIENPPLARSLYKTVEPGQSIPFELYAAVAGILAYLYRKKVEERARSDRQVKEKEQRMYQETSRTDWRGNVGIAGMRDFRGGM
ncbi:MAG: EscU/YscU/HrcU family type III secretion system export apparatus switch protein [Edaphobacter sp.]